LFGRPPWTGDQPVARPLPTHRTTQTEQTHTDIHASSGILTHDPSFRASEDSSCLRRAATLIATRWLQVVLIRASRWISLTVVSLSSAVVTLMKSFLQPVLSVLSVRMECHDGIVGTRGGVPSPYIIRLRRTSMLHSIHGKQMRN
jgi:hypothetical protein